MPIGRDRTALALLLSLGACASGPGPATRPTESGHGALAPFVESIPGTTSRLEMRPVPAGAGGGAFWMSRTEIPFDLFDVFVYRMDAADPDRPDDADGVTRPSRPYIPPDRGFGHAGFPAIGLSAKNAHAFCAWLSSKTGRRYRLPTEAEWERACGPDAGAPLDEAAWHAGNSGGTTHAVATKRGNALGLHDMLGNAAEWCVAPDGTHVVRGGSYLDAPADVHPRARERESRAWNASDPQIPKSPWWLVDNGFVGFRIVCEPGS